MGQYHRIFETVSLVDLHYSISLSLCLSYNDGLQDSIQMTLPPGGDLWTTHCTAVHQTNLYNKNFDNSIRSGLIREVHYLCEGVGATLS